MRLCSALVADYNTASAVFKYLGGLFHKYDPAKDGIAHPESCCMLTFTHELPPAASLRAVRGRANTVALTEVRTHAVRCPGGARRRRCVLHPSVSLITHLRS